MLKKILHLNFFSTLVLSFLFGLLALMIWRYLGIIGALFGVVSFAFYVKTTLGMANTLRRETQIEEVANALVHYYLTGIVLFTVLYFNTQQIERSLYDNNMPLEGVKSILQCFYFSVVTGTSLGYGDILAKGFFSRLFSIMQISFGPLFIFALFAIAFGSRRNQS